LLSLISGSGRAQDQKPDATIELSEGRVAAGVGFSWGDGTLTYKGAKHKVGVEGLSVGEVGITRATAQGKVFNLTKLEDFPGNYTAAGVGATLGGGANATVMKNQKGVTIEMVSSTQGASLKLATSGIKLTLK
jgi:hypothetical protein